ncbi:hypothetical protein TNIN_425221 [Trichonephila inaurata madagascariensis]|uniref:Uncharacterized protein n=1 Tax=Trichonephila inaurata madagascariensis TaxID=2747483 RepID=A0A8X6XBR1_9ARAC|nr:hypothetical protein TNIN_425221 [Trichonephila inaurata madagascariensis]
MGLNLEHDVQPSYVCRRRKKLEAVGDATALGLPLDLERSHAARYIGFYVASTKEKYFGIDEFNNGYQARVAIETRLSKSDGLGMKGEF